MQCTFAPGSFKNGQIGELEETPGLSAGAWQMRPLSRGYVEAKSNRPGEAPAINPRYLVDAGGHLDQHERADDHDRREGCGDDQRRSAPKDGGVAKAGARACPCRPVI